MTALQTASRKKLHELLDLIREVDERRYGPEWGIESQGDVADGHRNLMHLLEGGLFSHFDADPERPVFRRIVSPTRKFRGDNGDAIYFDAAIRADREYVVKGNMAGAVYVSITIEEGPGGGLRDGDGRPPRRRVRRRRGGQLRDRAVGGEARPELARADACREPDHDAPLLRGGAMRRGGSLPARPAFDRAGRRSRRPPAWTPEGQDERVAASLQRVIIRGGTRSTAAAQAEEQPSWVSTTPNVFNAPEKPGDLAFSAMDIAYTMAPYVIGPDQALVMTGRFPECRFANVCLWNRFIQSFDFNNRRISLNRKQTVLEPDGSFRMVIAHRDPGVPNWLDTEGRPFGMVYWCPPAGGRGRDAASRGGRLASWAHEEGCTTSERVQAARCILRRALPTIVSKCPSRARGGEADDDGEGILELDGGALRAPADRRRSELREEARDDPRALRARHARGRVRLRDRLDCGPARAVRGVGSRDRRRREHGRDRAGEGGARRRAEPRVPGRDPRGRGARGSVLRRGARAQHPAPGSRSRCDARDRGAGREARGLLRVVDDLCGGRRRGARSIAKGTRWLPFLPIVARSRSATSRRGSNGPASRSRSVSSRRPASSS